jgi:Protein of unknown function (DUF3047)
MSPPTFASPLVVRLAVLAATLLLTACMHLPEESRVALPEVPQLGRFSQARPGDELPGGWRLWTLSRFKKPTDYTLVKDGGHTVVQARSEASASGLVHDVKVNPREFPILSWRWKVDGLIPGADNTASDSEDSPVRVIVAFEGDVSKLDFEERIFATRLRLLTGHQMPYATLMYIWENKAAVGTVIESRHTSRVRMIVADSGSGRLGAWQDEARNVYEDYRRAFGEEPPMIKSIAIMTDTDNTGEQAHALYGDIAFLRAYPSNPSTMLD